MSASVPTSASSSDGLYESASAEELVMAREAALARMRSAGVSVLDVSPRLMAAAVINRYLEIKARASL
jgi:DnaJ-domain-containing protein 1